MVGVATGMAKTMAGGEILFVGIVENEGHGAMKLTGQLGDVMKESAEAAVSFVRANYLAKAGETDFFEKYDIHVHVPAGGCRRTGRAPAWRSQPPWRRSFSTSRSGTTMR